MSTKKLKSEYSDLDKYKNDVGDIWYCKKNTRLKHNPYGPAFLNKNGYKAYMIEDKYHRIDGAAVIYQDNTEEYWLNGIFIGDTKQEFYNKIKTLSTKNINKQDKINILNIKNSILLGLDSEGANILKLLLWQ